MKTANGNRFFTVHRRAALAAGPLVELTKVFLLRNPNKCVNALFKTAEL
jgi:hypothetical protein